MQQLWMCGRCHSLNEATSRNCYRCRADRASQEYQDPRGSPDGPGIAAVPAKDPSLIGATLLGLAGAASALVLWYWWDTSTAGARPFLVNRSFWYVGLFVGIIIGFGTILGGRGRTSFPIVLVSVCLTVATLVIGEYLLISNHVYNQVHVPTNRLVTLAPHEVIANLPAYIAEAQLRPFAWLGALTAAFLLPWNRLVGNTNKRDD